MGLGRARKFSYVTQPNPQSRTARDSHYLIDRIVIRSSTEGEEMHQQLFGGAIEMTIPDFFVDVSKIRQVPDNQECFTDSTKYESTIIVEIMEPPTPAEVAERGGSVARYYFTDLCEFNEAKGFLIEHEEAVGNGKVSAMESFRDSRISSIETIDGILYGITKFHERDHYGNDVRLYLAIIRIPSHNADLVISLTAPISISKESSSAAFSVADPQTCKNMFLEALTSCRVVDYSLFG